MMTKLSKRTRVFYLKHKDEIDLICKPAILCGALSQPVKYEKGLRDANIVKIFHVKDNQFLIAYRNFIFDLVDIEEMQNQMT